MEFKIINTSNNALPQYQTALAAGMDVCAFLQEPLQLATMQRFAVPTGLSIEIPAGFEAQLRPRSGLALKQGITLLNSPGTIDADYRGEIKVILINLSSQTQTIHPGDRIAQMVISPCLQIQWTSTETLTQTARNSGGFGSTGV